MDNRHRKHKPRPTTVKVGDTVKGLLYVLAGQSVYSNPFTVKRISDGEDGRIYWAEGGGGWSHVTMGGRVL